MTQVLTQIDCQLDATGMQCPMPLLKAKQALNHMGEGQVLEVWATDAGSWRDFAAFARQGSHQLLLAEEVNRQYHYLIKKGRVVSR